MREGLNLSRQLHDRGLTAEALAYLSHVAEFTGDQAEAVQYAKEAFEIGGSLGDDRLIGLAVGFLGLAVSGRAKKKRLLTQAVDHLRRAGDVVDCCWWLIHLAALELADEKPDAAAELLEEDLAICEQLDLPGEQAPALCVLADTRLLEVRFEEAAICLRRALILCARLGRQTVSDFPNVICCVARLGDLRRCPVDWRI